MRWLTVVLILLGASEVAAQGRGVPQNGYPDWSERMVLMYTNRARADPAADLAACPYTTCAEKDCYNTAPWGGPMAPVGYNYGLSRAARFHSTNLQKTGCFSHPSPCALVADLASKWDPNTGCDGSASCACQGGTASCAANCTTCSDTSDRVSLFTSGFSGENIAYGYPTPRKVFYAWFHEPETSSTCGFRLSNGHRVNMVTASHKSLGVGRYLTHYTQDFGSTPPPTGTLISGGHEVISGTNAVQFLGTSNNTVEFRVNYYDTRGAALEAKLNVDGTCTDMTMERGAPTNGTYLLNQTMLGDTCRRYVFSFKDPTGTIVKLPENGSYGVGNSTNCPDWSSNVPQACGGGGNTPPLILTQAAASPSPVTDKTTTLSVSAGDDTGEASLVYTWSQTAGPSGVTFSVNGTNLAKNTVATFPTAGAYTLQVTVKDPSNAAVTSSVNVTVNRTAKTVSVAPPAVQVQPSAQQQFTATVSDQWNLSWVSPPLVWTVTGGGTIDTAGLFTAGATTGGPYTVKAQSGSASGDAFVTIATGPSDTTPPQVFITAPNHGSDVTGTVTLAASAIDSGIGVAKVLFYVDDVQVGEDNTSPYDAAWNSDAATKGTHRVKARAVDFAGNAAETGEITVNALNGVTPIPDAGSGGGAGGDTIPPTVSIITPAQNAAITAPVDVEATASDNVGITSVILQVDGTSFATLTSLPWKATLEISTLSDGPHQLTAVARDVAGNQATSQAVTITVGAGAGGCGCASVASMWPVVGLVLVGVLRRRRR